jgi:hypothetical protein
MQDCTRSISSTAVAVCYDNGMLRQVHGLRDLADVRPAVSPALRQITAELHHQGISSPDPQMIQQCQTANVERELRVAPLDMYAVLLAAGVPPYHAVVSVTRIINTNIQNVELQARRQAMNDVMRMRRGVIFDGHFPPRVDADALLSGPYSWRHLPRPIDRSLIEAALHPPKPAVENVTDDGVSLP